MAYYLDTSAFLKLVVQEDGSRALGAWIKRRRPAFAASSLLRVEALRVARRHSVEATASVRQRLAAVTLISITPEILDAATILDPVLLRSLDAVHLATAMTLGEDLEAVISYDERLSDAARGYGIAVVSPGA